MYYISLTNQIWTFRRRIENEINDKCQQYNPHHIVNYCERIQANNLQIFRKSIRHIVDDMKKKFGFTEPRTRESIVPLPIEPINVGQC